MKNVTIFFGGASPERDVSVITGVLTANSLDKTAFNPIPVYVAADGTFYIGKALLNVAFYRNPDFRLCKKAVLLPGSSKLYSYKRGKLKEECNVDCAFNCMHGGGGEDGTLCGLLNVCRIPLASPPLFSSALSMDKHFTKIALAGMGVSVVDYVRVRRKGFFADSDGVTRVIGRKLGFPLIVKPSNLGSSIGITVAHDNAELFSALCAAFRYDGKAICEKYIEGARDINCAVYFASGGLVVSELEEAIRLHEVLTFDDKYGGVKSGASNRKFPADVGENIKDEVKRVVAKIYSELEFSGIVRFDFLLADNKVYLNEINAVPGSLAYYLFCDKLSDFSKLLTELVADAEKRKRETDGRVVEYTSSVLFGDFKGVKK